MQLHPADYSRSEREDLHREHYVLTGELAERYAPGTESFYIAADVGEVIQVGE